MKNIFNLNQTCPRFTCEETRENCLFGINPLNDKGNGITILLNPNSCHEKEYCSLPNENKIINASLIMERPHLEGQCKIFQVENNLKRYYLIMIAYYQIQYVSMENVQELNLMEIVHIHQNVR